MREAQSKYEHPEANKKTAEALFKEAYGKLYDEKIRALVEKHRFDAMISVVDKCKSVLNRRLVRVNDLCKPYDLMYEFDVMTDFGKMAYLYWDLPYGDLWVIDDHRLKDGVPPSARGLRLKEIHQSTSDDYPYNTILESLTERLVAARSGEQRKIFIPKGYYYFTWIEQWYVHGEAGPKTPQALGIKAENWTEALKELRTEAFRGNSASNFEAFLNNQSSKFRSFFEMEKYKEV